MPSSPDLSVSLVLSTVYNGQAWAGHKMREINKQFIIPVQVDWAKKPAHRLMHKPTVTFSIMMQWRSNIFAFGDYAIQYCSLERFCVITPCTSRPLVNLHGIKWINNTLGTNGSTYQLCDNSYLLFASVQDPIESICQFQEFKKYVVFLPLPGTDGKQRNGCQVIIWHRHGADRKEPALW